MSIFSVYSKKISKIFDLSSNNRTINYVGTIENTQLWNPLPRKFNEDSKLIIIPVDYHSLTDRLYDNFYCVRDLSLSDDKMSIRFEMSDLANSDEWNPPASFFGPISGPNAQQAKVHIFELDTSNDTSNYGIRFYNSTDYMSIASNQMNGSCYWSYSGNIKSGFELPKSIPNYQNSMVFANWNNSDICLRVDEDWKIRIYNRLFGLGNAVENTSIQLNVKLLAFASGPSILTKADLGVTIWSANGDIVFSSDFPPMKVNKYFKFAFLNQYTQSLPIGGNNFMLPISRGIGVILMPITVYSYSCQTLNFCMESGNVILSQGKLISKLRTNIQQSTSHWEIPQIDVPVLDSNDYF